MKRSSKTSGIRSILLLLGAGALLLGGCAAPPASGSLQRRIDELLQIQQQQAEQLNALQQQLTQLQLQPSEPLQPVTETEISPIEATPQVASAAPLLPVAAPDIAAMSESAALYLEAFAAIATGRMTDAEAGFASFVQRYPDHEYAGNAKYWQAEALLAQQKPRYAETLLLEIIDNPQEQNKAPDAMARLVRYYRESGAKSNAEAMLQLLSSRFPESPALNRLQRSAEPR